MQQKVLPFSLKATAWLLSGMGSLFPGLAAQIFFRLYGTPPKRRLREAHVALRVRAMVRTVSFTQYAFGDTPIRIETYTWDEGISGGGPGNGKKVLLMHGWSDTALGFPGLVDELLQAGYTVTAFDAPAHGSSQGKWTNLVQWIHILDQFLQAEGPVYAVIGHSVGALVSAITLSRKGHPVPKLVLAGAPLSAPAFFQDTFDLFRIRPRVIAKVYRLVETRLHDDLHRMDLNDCIGAMPAASVLMIFDGNDQLVRAEEVEAFLALHPSVRSARIEGSGHFRILRDPMVSRRIVAFLGTDG